MRGNTILAVAGLAVAIAAVPADTSGDPELEGKVLAVKMVDFAFQPARLVVAQGDVIRFVQNGVQPHNVEFRAVPQGVNLGDKRMGAFVVTKGQSYELAIDRRFAPGTYEFVCTPHEGMGMKGTLVVEPAG